MMLADLHAEFAGREVPSALVLDEDTLRANEIEFLDDFTDISMVFTDLAGRARSAMMLAPDGSVDIETIRGIGLSYDDEFAVQVGRVVGLHERFASLRPKSQLRTQPNALDGIEHPYADSMNIVKVFNSYPSLVFIDPQDANTYSRTRGAYDPEEVNPDHAYMLPSHRAVLLGRSVAQMQYPPYSAKNRIQFDMRLEADSIDEILESVEQSS